MRGDAEKFELGIAQKKIATALEDQLDRHLETTNPALIQQFRNARQQFAKIYSVEDALTPNGNISPAVLARQLKRGVPLSAGLKDIAEAYLMDKRAHRTVDDLGGKGEFSRLDLLVGGAEMIAHPERAGIIAAALGARPLARAAITSPMYQARAIGPTLAEPGIMGKAARGVTNLSKGVQSPTLGGVYEQKTVRGQQAQAGEIPIPGSVRGSFGVLDGPGRANLGYDKPLEGLPAVHEVDGKQVTFGPLPAAREAAERYAKASGIPYNPPTQYAKVDPKRATRIADAYEQMRHDPSDPKVQASYQAMVKETIAQWEEIKKTGLKVEFIEGEDPYENNPRKAILDVQNNNHLWVYPTDSGYGEGTAAKDFDIKQQPLLQIVEGETISGKPVRANDIFRIVHDYFGHIKEGVGFRASGEENAWRSHASMYSDLARPAMTSETRGQNSWVNYGPHAEFNKTASGKDTKYAPQKIGLMPDWSWTEGVGDTPAKPTKSTRPHTLTSVVRKNSPLTIMITRGSEANQDQQK
jgi:hypothetical protein